jgi:hypothetical protein
MLHALGLKVSDKESVFGTQEYDEGLTKQPSQNPAGHEPLR